MNPLALMLLVIVGTFGFCLWHGSFRSKKLKFHPGDSHGTARFANEKDLRKAGYLREGGLQIGYLGKKPLYYNGKGHIAIIAGARMGKLFTVLGNLIFALSKRYSLLLIDPKGEVTCIGGWWRRKFGPVNVWNPYGLWPRFMKGLRQVRINPMADIDPNSSTVVSDCRKLVSTFCTEENAYGDPYFRLSSHNVISGSVVSCLTYEKPEDSHLGTVRAILTGSNGRSIFDFAEEMKDSKVAFIREVFSRFTEKGARESKEIASVMAQAIADTDFLADPNIVRALSAADVSLKDLKRKAGMTITVCLPANRMDNGKCAALIAGWTLHCMVEEAQQGGQVPVVAVIDEMSQLGYSKAWFDAFGLAAGMGMQLVVLYQDISQVMKQFGQEGWATVIQNCGAILAFGCRDRLTREFISFMSGVAGVVSWSRSWDYSYGQWMPRDSASQQGRPLVTPDEAANLLKDDEMWLLGEGLPGIAKINRRKYTEMFRGRFRPNPYYGGKK